MGRWLDGAHLSGLKISGDFTLLRFSPGVARHCPNGYTIPAQVIHRPRTESRPTYRVLCRPTLFVARARKRRRLQPHLHVLSRPLARGRTGGLIRMNFFRHRNFTAICP